MTPTQREGWVEYDPAQVDPEVLVAAVTETGFEATVKDDARTEEDAAQLELEATPEGE